MEWALGPPTSGPSTTFEVTKQGPSGVSASVDATLASHVVLPSIKGANNRHHVSDKRQERETQCLRASAWRALCLRPTPNAQLMNPSARLVPQNAGICPGNLSLMSCRMVSF